MKRLLLAAATLAALTGCAQSAPQKTEKATTPGMERTAFPAPSIEGLPAGQYVTDPIHSSLTFKVNHLGFSHFTARFATFRGVLDLDLAHPEAAHLDVTIDPRSLVLNAPPEGFHDTMMSKMFFDATAYPAMTFKSTKIEKTGDFAAKVTGDLTLHGVTRAVTLDVAFNGGYPGMAKLDPQARIGFSARGMLKRSDFGMGMGVPPAGTRMGVSDDVEFEIETEMLGPKLKSTGANG